MTKPIDWPGINVSAYRGHVSSLRTTLDELAAKLNSSVGLAQDVANQIAAFEEAVLGDTGGGGPGPDPIGDTFGTRNLAGTGAIPVTGATIMSGNTNNWFQISGGALSISATGEGAITAGVYNLVLSDASEHEVTVVDDAYYVLADGAEIDGANVDHILNQSTPSTIFVRSGVITNLAYGDAGPGFFDERTFLNRDYSGKKLTLKSADTNNRATFNDYRILVGGCTDIRFENLSFRQTVDTFATQFMYDNANENVRPEIIGCDFQGRAIDYTYDWYGNDPVSNPAKVPGACTFSASRDWKIQNNTTFGLYQWGTPKCQGTCVLSGNTFVMSYYDGIQFDPPTVTTGNDIQITDNTIIAVFGARWNAASGPHADGFQFKNGHFYDVTLERNVVAMGDVGVTHNGDDQQTIFGDTSTHFTNITIRYNILAGQALHGISLANINGTCYIGYNTVMENDPYNSVGQGLTPLITIGGTSSTGTCTIENNIAQSLVVTAGTAVFIDTGHLQVTSGTIGTIFPSGTFKPDSRAAAITAFTPGVGSAGADKGALTTAGEFRVAA